MLRHEEFMKQKAKELYDMTIKQTTITLEQRRELLSVYNNLKDALQYADDCRTLELRHLDNMEKAMMSLREIVKLEPQKDSDGHSMCYADYVLKEDADEKV
tara:strand:- start:8676 stop:8978 length:303 start_codon:yes stop_codon:yes gene_type:complete